MTTSGTVYLVGAGPGDPELLTVKAERLIGEADIILHDALVGEEIIEETPAPDAEIVYVGKRPGGGRWRQEEINRLMVQQARAGDTVVRLKGGDPMVFGRGGEEAEFLAERNVPFEIVPGVTSAVAAPELAGIPLTHRDHASSLTVVTGHEDPTKPESALDWEALAANVTAGGTLAILMGVGRLEENTRTLVDHGVPPETPTAVVEKAASPDGAVTSGSLDTIAERSREAGVEPPAVVIIGDVVRVRDAIRDVLIESTPRLAPPEPEETRQLKQAAAVAMFTLDLPAP